MEQHVEEGKTGQYKKECAASEQAREREIARGFMKDRYGLVESKKPDYRPVKKR